MTEENIEKIRKDVITEIKEKVRKNSRFLHPTNKERLEYQEKLKFTNGNEFTNWMQQVGIMKNPTDIKRRDDEKTVENARCKTMKEYKDDLAKDAGFKDNTDRVKKRRHKTGRNLPMEFNEYCTSYFGVYIGEQQLYKEYLLTIFEYVERKDYGNPGYDFLCKYPRQEFIDRYPQFKLEKEKEYKVQLGLRCLYYPKDKSPFWNFFVRHNDIPDFFLYSGWDNRKSLQPIYHWFFHKDEMIRYGNSYSTREKFWKRESFTITYNTEYIKRFKKDELPIDKLKELYDRIKKEEDI